MSDYDDYDYNEGNDQNDEDIIGNMMAEAEDNQIKNPKESIRLFSEVIRLEQEQGLNNYSIEAYQNILLIQKNFGEIDQISKYIDQFFLFFKNKYQVQCLNVLTIVIQNLINMKGQCNSVLAIQKILKELKQNKYYPNFVNASLKFVKSQINARVYDLVPQLLNDIEYVLQSGEIKDQDKYNQYNLEIIGFSILYYRYTKQHNLLQGQYKKLLRIQNFDQNQEPFVQAIINETLGQFKGLERQYTIGRKKLMEAFNNYLDLGYNDASRALKYAIVVSILENFKMNLFDDMRTKLYDKDADMQPFKKLRQSFENQDISTFSQILSSDVFIDDPYLNEIKPQLQKIIVETKILMIAKCYTRIRLSYLEDQLLMSRSQVIKCLSGLITKKQLNAEIDEVDAFVEIKELENDNTECLSQLISSLK